ncbi:MAG: hypothetical protein ACMG6E_01650 [Candidatus Roizmanbacteria bacterium]
MNMLRTCSEILVSGKKCYKSVKKGQTFCQLHLARKEATVEVLLQPRLPPTITFEEVKDILSQDAFYRRRGDWPLPDISELSRTRLHRPVTGMFSIEKSDVAILDFIFDKVRLLARLNTAYPLFSDLFEQPGMKGHLVAAGGAIFKVLSCHHLREGDVDFFFYDLTEEEATALREQAIVFLFESFKKIANPDNEHNDDIDDIDHAQQAFRVERNQFVTTVTVVSGGDPIEYQFIHRIYPSVSSIIGGFDLGPCMVAYDGDRFCTTPLGAWSIQNKAIIIDTKRRSPSFEHRIIKYMHLHLRVIFPGLSANFYQLEVANPDDFEFSDKAVQFLIAQKQLAASYGYNLGNDHEKYTERVIHKIEENKPRVRLPFISVKPGDRYSPIKVNRVKGKGLAVGNLSDYNHNSMYKSLVPVANATRLRHGDLKSVVSFFNVSFWDNDVDIRDELQNDLMQPNFGVDKNVIKRYRNKLQKWPGLRHPDLPSQEEYTRRLDRICPSCDKLFDEWATLDLVTVGDRKYHQGCDLSAKPEQQPEQAYQKYVATENAREEYRFRRMTVRHFGEYTTKDISIPAKRSKYAAIIIKKLQENQKECTKLLTGISWITKVPGGQYHTSSFNPIMKDPREWYGKEYRPVVTGVPEETTLRLIRNFSDSPVRTLSNDVLRIILYFIAAAHAHDALQYIPNRSAQEIEEEQAREEREEREGSEDDDGSLSEEDR